MKNINHTIIYLNKYEMNQYKTLTITAKSHSQLVYVLETVLTMLKMK